MLISETLELKSILSKAKNIIEGIKSRTDQTEEGIDELKDKVFENTQVGEYTSTKN